MIFVDETFIGGYSDLESGLESGEIKIWKYENFKNYIFINIKFIIL